MKNVLITGVGGFIGRAIAKSLSDEGNSILVGLMFDSHSKLPPEVDHAVYGDVRNTEVVRRVISDYEINVVYHMAAQSIVRICANDPVSAYDINVMGTVSVLDACRTSGASTVESVVVSTSDKAFGHAEPPYTEETPLLPKFTYEASKTCQDIVTRSYAHNYGVPAKVARCSNVYGPGDDNLSRLIPRSITRIAAGEPPVLYDGVHDFVREFIHVDDVVAAFDCINKLGIPGEAYCVGGSGHYKILSVINEIISIMGSDVTPEIVVRNKNFKEIHEQWIDASKLSSLGWTPKVDLHSGLKSCVDYYSNNSNNSNIIL